MSSAARHSQAVGPKSRSAGSYDHETNDMEDRLVAEQFIQRVLKKLETKDQPQLSGSEKPDLQPVQTSATTEDRAECEDHNASKLPQTRTDSVTTAVTDVLGSPISGVEDDSRDVPSDFSSTKALPPSEDEVGREPIEESIRLSGPEDDDFEGARGEIDSLSSEHFIELSGARLTPSGKKKRNGRSAKEETEDSVVTHASHNVKEGQQQSTTAKLDPINDHYCLEKSDSGEFSSNRQRLELKKTHIVETELEDTASNLGTVSIEARDAAEESAQQPRPESDISLLYTEPLKPEDVINPFSLEVRIRKAREEQNIAQEWKAETSAENVAGISQQLNLEEAIRLALPVLDEESLDQATGSSERAVENGLASQVKKRVRTEPTRKEDCEEDAKEISRSKAGVGEAVLLGALASGVNRPTWFVVRAVLVGLVLSLLMLLQVAIKSGSWFVLLNVLFLITLAGGLIILLGWYVSEIGLVSLDKQMAELNLTSEPDKVESKTL